MMRSGENNHHVHDGSGKEMASSLDVNDTDEDKDEDESNNPIARSFDEPSAENLESESDCNIVNTTPELNCDEHIHTDISDGIPCLFVFFRPCFGLEIQSGYQPLS